MQTSNRIRTFYNWAREVEKNNLQGKLLFIFTHPKYYIIKIL